MVSSIETTARKDLADMTPGELRQWLVKRRKLLVHHKRFVQRYLDRRQRQRGKQKQTYTDREYAQFQRLATDLLELLEGVISNVEQHTRDATGGRENTL